MTGPGQNVPATTPQEGNAVLIADLDKIAVKTAAFRLHGVTRYIRPVSAEMFFRYADAIAEMGALRRQNLANQEKFVEALYEVSRHVVDPITLDDIKRCSLQQQAALYTTILDCVTGKVSEPVEVTEKKKTIAPKKSRFSFG